MALLNIRKDGDEVLRKKSKEVKEITPRVKEIISDMYETMYHANGIGLAAPQIGILKRIIVVDVGDEENRDPRAFINPEIVKEEGCEKGQEGCLSVPGVAGLVDRPVKITLKAMNENGENIELEAEDLFARCICHEVDHLNGVLFTDKAEILSEEDLRRMEEEYQEEKN